MKFRNDYKIIFPFFIYIIVFILYLLIAEHIPLGIWNDIVFYTILIGLPLLFLIISNILLVKIYRKSKNLITFVISAPHGLPSGLLIGYGAAAVIFPATLSGFIQALLIFGILGGLISGTLGLIINFFINLIKGT